MQREQENTLRADYISRMMQDSSDRKTFLKLRAAQKVCQSLDTRDDESLEQLLFHLSSPIKRSGGRVYLSGNSEEDANSSETRSFIISSLQKINVHWRYLIVEELEKQDAELSRKELFSRSTKEDDRDEETVFESIVEDKFDMMEYIQLDQELYNFEFVLSIAERLIQVLEYLRVSYFYCFWCGCGYANKIDLESNCPGLEEDDHD